MRPASRPLKISATLVLATLFLGIGAVGHAQVPPGQPSFPTRSSQTIPGAPASIPSSIPTTMPTVPTTPTAPQTQDSGGGFSNYVNGLPTKLTLPDGTVVDLTIPENTIPEMMTELSTVPKVPKAFETVTVTVKNFSTKLEEDRITWSVNGRIVQDAIGGDSITTTMGKIGESISIRVSIVSRSLGKTLTKDLLIAPGDVAILWEANTYVPPFYKGKPLPSYKSTIKLVPLPTMIAGGRNIAPENLLYKWTRNYRNVKGLSGYGKTSSVFETSGGSQQERLQLSVSHPESGAATERTVIIDIAEPKVLLYAGSPLQGIRYERALGKNVTLDEQETTVRAEPFFFSNEELESGVSALRFTQNGKPISSLLNTIILSRPSQSGTSRIDASIDNPTRVLQSARSGFTISFSAPVE